MRFLTPSEVVRINEQESGPDLLADFGLAGSSGDASPTERLWCGCLSRHPYESGGDDALADPQPPVPGRQQANRVLSVILLYNLNSFAIEADQGDVVALALDIAEGQIDVEGISGILKGWSRSLELPTE